MPRKAEWNFAEISEMDKENPILGAKKLPTGPPCSGCESWNPRRVLTTDGPSVWIEDTVCCTVETDNTEFCVQANDFRCFTPRR